ncbi:MAG TPA: UDP-3-O-(3-hydroxymyristoyl)glucosamine N-acyltransferase [Candidatus Pelagibacter bacterium]|jgi:UDP-3-O-[3-hydroxymyristoyl] glucosamine N-acyltransferase|nr:UDP-3-O-(3-hydroxymyristoyl)glucosamine N-acyltransferase [Pelagibacteraceae bacterium]HJN84481.1 UDP-3-O-(3-hydroxymyristoyl)glucosamine N-acyltransferase [Candidatus Pelagibacter bacterium]|tara:strand:- start:1397 stop:2395 length:999 start_codon:yes stop_codon:yes gene_type:complete
MFKNSFFKNKGPVSLKLIFDICNFASNTNDIKIKLHDVKNLEASTNKDITFFHSIKYKDQAKLTKAKFCITTNNLFKLLPNSCKPIVVENVLLSLAKVAKLFYPNSTTDDFKLNLKKIKKSFIKKNNLCVGYNVLVGKNVLIGNKSSIGHNTIIEDNVIIGSNCSIGSNVILRNTILKKNIHILDGCIIGKKGFGFFPYNFENFKYPHIGCVVINENSEIGSGCTIDRGSFSDTIIGKNTFFDNQIHIAHNVKIGDNCIIAGQVGIAGSSIIGNNVMIGGQAGISGHLMIGNNVRIGGGSGVIKNIPDNTKVMGYPAIEIKKFLRKIKNNSD